MKKNTTIATIAIPLLLLGMLLYSCVHKGKQPKSTLYQAIKDKDTAILALHIDQDRFYGQYEMRYGKMGKDSGEVRGSIKGDSLRGVYTYISYGGSWKKAPIALLKKNNKLFLGKGVEAILLGEPCYLPEVPVDYTTPGFIFEEIKNPSKK